MAFRVRNLFAVTVVVGALACAKPEADPIGPVEADQIQQIAYHPISFRLEVEEGTEGALAYEYPWGGRIWLGPKHLFNLESVAVVRASTSDDREGVPMVSFRIAENEVQKFNDFTAAHVNGNIGIGIHEEIAWVGFLMDPLHGGGLIPSRKGEYTLEEAEAVAASLLISNE